MVKELLSRKSLAIGSFLTKKQIFLIGQLPTFMCSILTFVLPGWKTPTVFSQPSVSPSGFELWTNRTRKMLTERGAENLTPIFKLGRTNSFTK